jgi:diguanylate cyclase (GGDEF)-like protein
MSTSPNFDLRRGPRLRDLLSFRQAWVVVLLFAALIAIEALGFLVLGTGQAGQSVAESVLVLANLLSLACAWLAFRRAQGITALFWFLFAAALVVLLIPTTLQTFDTLFDQTILSDSTLRLLYCLYGAPILMMLFLPDMYRRARVKSEILLDLFQIAIVVGLIYSTFFFLPVQRMLPADALMHNISISDAQSLLLLIAVLVRLQSTRVPGTRSLLLRLGLFLLVCAIATYIGDWIDLHHYLTAAAWFDLGWAIPQVAAGLVAITWSPSPEPQSTPEPANFLGFLGTNLVLVAMLSCIALLTDRWKQAYGGILTNVAIAASLLAFTFRLALTQFHQYQEIIQRKAAQQQLAASHQQIGHLLDDARQQTAEITRISELGSLLQACTSREEVFRLIPERLRRLFPGGSGSISLISASKNRLESVAEWGICPTNRIFSPEECWALRRGHTHFHHGRRSDPRCSHLLGEGPSVCIPLIASGEAIGVLSIQEDDFLSPIPDPDHDFDSDSDTFARRRQIAAAVAEHVALAVANLNLREALRVQGVRDPLTGLYNRRYMQEFLDHALHAARRRHRSLAVMMIDLDHFKRYNDNFGHSAGDRILAAVGEMLLRCIRAEDVACRYGGEEFTLILTECTLQQATIRADEIRKRLHECRTQPCTQPNDQAPDSLTVSIGVAAFDETIDRADLLLKFADDALYAAKRAGRNRVMASHLASVLHESDLAETGMATIASTEKA